MLFSEPKISQCVYTWLSETTPGVFQCSSASRKFLNSTPLRTRPSASSVSVLFSEPKISQFAGAPIARASGRVSVLFSEPKISQYLHILERVFDLFVSVLFSEPKISQCPRSVPGCCRPKVSVLFSEPKISQCAASRADVLQRIGFSALQRAENFSIRRCGVVTTLTTRFQCSSASRKFLNSTQSQTRETRSAFQCSSASRKFLNPDPRTCIHPYSRPR